jgi:hypothetical protein
MFSITSSGTERRLQTHGRIQESEQGGVEAVRIAKQIS